MSKLDGVHRTSILVLITLCLISLSVNSQNANSTNAVSSNNECEEEIQLYLRVRWLKVIFRFTDVIRLPLNISDFTTDPSFISIDVTGSISPEEYYFALGRVVLTTQERSKADFLVAEFEKLLNITLPYSHSVKEEGHHLHRYVLQRTGFPVIQEFRDVFLARKPSEGFDKILTPTLLEKSVTISFSLEREAGNLKWKTTVEIDYEPVHYPKSVSDWVGRVSTLSLRELTNYSETISASPYSTKSVLKIGFYTWFSTEEVIALETIPSQMEMSKEWFEGATFITFEGDITGGSIEDFYIRFKYVVPWWFLIGVTVVIVGVAAFFIGVGINPLKKFIEWYERRGKTSKEIILGGLVIFVLFLLGFFGYVFPIGFTSLFYHIMFLFNPFFGFSQYGWIGVGVWLGIWIAIAFVAIFPLARKLKKRKEKRKEPSAWELEDQLKGLKEQLDLGTITQEEYEQKKKKLMEKSGG